ncbi:dehydrogenase [Trebonia kvetii]|uniref:Dehydrogenase n=1 Tax=Trebonia kvetii TaxID=2480626 RepID=A0A6P2C821_9ACTN|nr:acyl-CoA dehydrogenase family protein [Trebonia kvetii]TVZ05683.1 dehydrogenase [Trebonia kvetii]
MSEQSVTDFRNRARAWLEANAPRRGSGDEGSEAGRADIAAQQAFQAKLYDAGFAGISWPKEYGGQGLTDAEQIAFGQVARDYALPVGVFFIGLGMPGPTILELGTEEQKKRYLPKMLRGEEIWCQLFSEPAAGSDVASLTTSAVPDGDGWVLNGQKVWTSGAQYSHYGAVIARTDPTVPKHNGITMFIVDMHSPGVTVRPLKVATGATPFNEVYFDQVRLPAGSVIGEVNDGWRAAVVMLRNERVNIGTMGAPRTSPLSYHALSSLAAKQGDSADPGLRRKLAELYVRERSVRLFGQLLREEAMAGRDPGPRGSVAKLAGAELGTFASLVAAEVLGPAVAASDSEEVREVLNAALSAPGSSVAGGTNEIQRNIIGERVLGLPKDPGVDRSTPFNQLRVGTLRKN